MVGPLVGVFVYTPTILTGGSTALHHTAANPPHASETNQRIQPKLRLKLMPFGTGVIVLGEEALFAMLRASVALDPIPSMCKANQDEALLGKPAVAPGTRQEA